MLSTKNTKTKFWVCDFETTTLPNFILEKCVRVWLWCIYNPYKDKYNIGYNIRSFMNQLILLCSNKEKNYTFWFHNLKFDGKYILDYLNKESNWTYSRDLLLDKSFTFSIIDGVWYSIKLRLNNKIITILDSMKKTANNSIEKLAKDYGLEQKGIIEHNIYRPINYIPTEKEIDYCKRDTEIIGKVLKIQYDKGMIKATTSSDTMYLYKKHLKENGLDYDLLFPRLTTEEHNYIKDSYYGGVSMIRENMRNHLLKNVFIYDVNSMYPWVLATKKIPYGIGQFFKGRYQENMKYPLYFQRINVTLRLKKNHIPSILLKKDNKYLETTENMENDSINLTLNSIDFELMWKQYHVLNIYYVDGYMYQSSNKMFKKYIINLYKQKSENSGATKEIAKLLMNALYGKFGSNNYAKFNSIVNMVEKIIKIDDKEILTNAFSYLQDESTKEEVNTFFIPVASYTTSYARKELITMGQKNYKDFVYCDTDSLHLLTDKPKAIKVDSKKIGWWDFEKHFTDAVYLRPKAYMGIDKNNNKLIRCSGMTDKIKKIVTFNNFKIGSCFENLKLKNITVNGGALLVTTPYKISDKIRKFTA